MTDPKELPTSSDEPLEPDAVTLSGDQLFDYDKGQAPAAEAVKRRRRPRPGGGGRGKPPSAERQNEGRRR